MRRKGVAGGCGRPGGAVAGSSPTGCPASPDRPGAPGGCGPPSWARSSYQDYRSSGRCRSGARSIGIAGLGAPGLLLQRFAGGVGARPSSGAGTSWVGRGEVGAPGRGFLQTRRVGARPAVLNDEAAGRGLGRVAAVVIGARRRCGRRVCSVTVRRPDRLQVGHDCRIARPRPGRSPIATAGRPAARPQHLRRRRRGEAPSWKVMGTGAIRVASRSARRSPACGGTVLPAVSSASRRRPRRPRYSATMAVIDRCRRCRRRSGNRLDRRGQHPVRIHDATPCTLPRRRRFAVREAQRAHPCAPTVSSTRRRAASIHEASDPGRCAVGFPPPRPPSSGAMSETRMVRREAGVAAAVTATANGTLASDTRTGRRRGLRTESTARRSVAGHARYATGRRIRRVARDHEGVADAFGVADNAAADAFAASAFGRSICFSAITGADHQMGHGYLVARHLQGRQHRPGPGGAFAGEDSGRGRDRRRPRRAAHPDLRRLLTEQRHGTDLGRTPTCVPPPNHGERSADLDHAPGRRKFSPNSVSSAHRAGLVEAGLERVHRVVGLDRGVRDLDLGALGVGDRALRAQGRTAGIPEAVEQAEQVAPGSSTCRNAAPTRCVPR